MESGRLEQAIGLVQAGEMDKARAVLEPILKEERHNILAWRWYAGTWPKPSDQIRVWELCLRHNPSSQEAQQALASLKPVAPVKERLAASKAIHRSSRLSPGLLWVMIGILGLIALIAVAAVIRATPKDPAAYHHTQPVEYYLYVPRNYSADKEWPLFVGIHGSGSSGLECWNLWQPYADREGFILLCPTIPGSAEGYYQDVGERTVWSAVGQVRKEYRVKSRIFLSGFSAGAFFIQGFIFHYPQAVSGLAILSAGNYLNPGMFTTYVPMLVVIGDWDNATAVQTSQLFVNELEKLGYDVQFELLPRVGHTVTRKGISLTIDLFRNTISK